ncbi:hypothetical protein [Streptomyces sp. NPDC047718]|uniref:hypothetical protein n=1 Tax=Streptomyces sp. NPDC047718 TaxID=3155479 RepID=UPI0033C02203
MPSQPGGSPPGGHCVVPRALGRPQLVEPYVDEEVAWASRQHEVHTFDPDVRIEFDEFEDVVGRHFRQPPQGLGLDGSPVAHMWRTMIWPNNFL